MWTTIHSQTTQPNLLGHIWNPRVSSNRFLLRLQTPANDAHLQFSSISVRPLSAIRQDFRTAATALLDLMPTGPFRMCLEWAKMKTAFLSPLAAVMLMVSCPWIKLASIMRRTALGQLEGRAELTTVRPEAQPLSMGRGRCVCVPAIPKLLYKNAHLAIQSQIFM